MRVAGTGRPSARPSRPRRRQDPDHGDERRPHQGARHDLHRLGGGANPGLGNPSPRCRTGRVHAQPGRIRVQSGVALDRRQAQPAYRTEPRAAGTRGIRSGCLSAGFGEGKPLVAEVGDDLQAAAEGFDAGGQGAQFGGAWLGVLDGGHRPWAMPIRAATWVWVMPRRRRISASRTARCSARSCSIPAAMAALSAGSG